MNLASIRIVAAAAGVAALIFSANPTVVAQNADPKGGSQRQQPAEADSQKKVDEYTEAAKVLGSPAGNTECVWHGRLAVNLLYGHDLDTAFRHMELYDRFGCPAGHIQMAFRCYIAHVAKHGKSESKTPEGLPSRIQACWLNPSPDVNPLPSAAAPTGSTSR
jgi:hypothetical protein